MNVQIPESVKHLLIHEFRSPKPDRRTVFAVTCKEHFSAPRTVAEGTHFEHDRLGKLDDLTGFAFGMLATGGAIAENGELDVPERLTACEWCVGKGDVFSNAVNG